MLPAGGGESSAIGGARGARYPRDMLRARHLLTPLGRLPGLRRDQPGLVGHPGDPAAGAGDVAGRHRTGRRPDHAVPDVLSALPTVTEGQPEIEQSDRPRWPPVGDPAPLAKRRTVVRVGARAGVGRRRWLRCLWWLGHEIPAAILATVLVLVTAASLLSPAVAAAADRGDLGDRAVGRALPGRRAAGRRAACWSSPRSRLCCGSSATTRWRSACGRTPRASGARSRNGRGSGAGAACTAGRSPTSVCPVRGRQREPAAVPARARGPGRRRCRGPRWTSRSASRSTLVGRHRRARAGQPAGLARTSPAGREEPWLEALGDEISAVWDRKPYDPFLGWTMPDFKGRYVHVEDGVRRSAPAAAARDGRPASRSSSSAARRCSGSSSATSTRSRPSSRGSPRPTACRCGSSTTGRWPT